MLTIAWDIDDVLNNLMYEWFNKYWLPNNPDSRLNYQDLTLNPPHVILGIGLNEYLYSLDSFRASSDYANIEPIHEILDWFNEYGDHFNHIALTAVPYKYAHKSSEWLVKNFGRWIRSYNFIPSPRPNDNLFEYHRSKAEFLKFFNKIDIFIDDSMNNIDLAIEAGFKCMVMPRPWNNAKGDVSDLLKELTCLLT